MDKFCDSSRGGWGAAENVSDTDRNDSDVIYSSVIIIYKSLTLLGKLLAALV